MSDVTPEGAGQSANEANSNDTRPIDSTETIAADAPAGQRPWTLNAVLAACLASLLVGGVLGASLGVLVAQHRSDDRRPVMRQSRHQDFGRVAPDDRQSRRQSPWTSPGEQRWDGNSDRTPSLGGSQGFELDPQTREFVLEMLKGLGTQFLEQMQERAQEGNGKSTDRATPDNGTAPDRGRTDAGKNG